MNPVTLLNAIVQSYGEGKRRQQFGPDYQEKRALAAVQAEKTLRSIPLDEQRAATEAELAQAQIKSAEDVARERAVEFRTDVELGRGAMGPADPDDQTPELDIAARGRAARLSTKDRLEAEKAAAEIAASKFRDPNYEVTLGEGARKEFGLGEGPVTQTEADFAAKVALAKRQEAAQIKAAGISASNRREITPYQQLQQTNQMARMYNLEARAARKVGQQFAIMENTYKRFEAGGAKDRGGTTQAIVNTFNKIMDEGSVVRESEYARSAQGQALWETIYNKGVALVEGGPGLSPESLKEYVELARVYNARAQASLQQEQGRVQAAAEQFGLNPALIIRELGEAPPGTGAPGGAKLYKFQGKSVPWESLPSNVQQLIEKKGLR